MLETQLREAFDEDVERMATLRKKDSRKVSMIMLVHWRETGEIVLNL